MAAQEYQAPESVGRLQQRALFVGGVALLVSILAPCALPGLLSVLLDEFPAASRPDRRLAWPS